MQIKNHESTTVRLTFSAWSFTIYMVDSQLNYDSYPVLILEVGSMEVQAKDFVSFLWLVFWAVVFYSFRHEAKALISAIIERIQKGSRFKVAGMEFDELKYEGANTEQERSVIEKTPPAASSLTPEVKKAIRESIGDEKRLILLNSIRRLERLVKRFARRESSYWVGGITLPKGFETLPFKEMIQYIKVKLPVNVINDLILVVEMRDKIVHMRVEELSDVEFIKSATTAYLKAERLIDYFQDRLFLAGF